MIYPLRRRHRVMVIALSIVVPILFVVSLLARQAPHEPNGEIPLTAEPLAAEYTEATGVSGSFAAQPAIEYRVLNHQSGRGLAIELSATESLRIPELLVYWSPSGGERTETLPDDHVLLGSWAVTSTGVLALPERVQAASGSIVLYSLSQKTIVASTLIN